MHISVEGSREEDAKHYCNNPPASVVRDDEDIYVSRYLVVLYNYYPLGSQMRESSLLRRRHKSSAESPVNSTRFRSNSLGLTYSYCQRAPLQFPRYTELRYNSPACACISIGAVDSLLVCSWIAEQTLGNLRFCGRERERQGRVIGYHGVRLTS